MTFALNRDQRREVLARRAAREALTDIARRESYMTIGRLRQRMRPTEALQFKSTACRRPSRRTEGAPSCPRTIHRSDAQARADTIRVGTICRVAAT